MTFGQYLGWIFTAGLVPLIAGRRENRETRDDDEDDRTVATRNTATAPSTQSASSRVASQPVVYNFDSDAAGKEPDHFSFARTGRGPEGSWVVKEDPSAPPKPNLLAQTSVRSVS
jgi:hypothetical protein